MTLGMSKSTVARSAVLFICVSAAVMIGILVWTTDAETWRHVTDFRPLFIPVVLALAAFRWWTDGMIFTALTGDGAGRRVGPLRGAVIRLEGNLISVIVPVFIGMFSMHAVLLKREKMEWGESLAVSAMRALLPIFLFLLNIPILLWWRAQGNGGTVLQKVIEVLLVPVIAAVLLVTAALFLPKRIEALVSTVVRRFRRDPRAAAAVEEKLSGQIDRFSRVFRLYFREKSGRLLAAAGWTLATFLADSAVAVSVLWGFGFRPDLAKAAAFLYMIWPIVYLAPTPGSTGAFEFSYLGFYGLFMPKSLIGLAVLIVRLALTYLPMIAGAVYLVREFRRDDQLKTLVLDRRFSDAEA
jgi:uncharacterized protein (TIRG00374 family)